MIKSYQLCASIDGIGDGAGSCAGDSGSPALKKDFERGTFYQVGVLHGSVASCSATVFPAVFTRLDHPDILSFLTRTLQGKITTTSTSCRSDQFRCLSGVCKHTSTSDCRGPCITKRWLNDGDEDCTDGSDESKFFFEVYFSIELFKK